MDMCGERTNGSFLQVLLALVPLSVSEYTSVPLWKLSFRNLLFSCYFLLNQNNFLCPPKVTPYVIVAFTHCCYSFLSSFAVVEAFQTKDSFCSGFSSSLLLPVS